MNRGDWWATVHGVAKSWTRLSMRACMHIIHSVRGRWKSIEKSARDLECKHLQCSPRAPSGWGVSQLQDSATTSADNSLCTYFSTAKQISDHHWIVVVQLLSHVRLFATPWTTALQASLSVTISQSFLKPMSIELVMPSNHFIELLNKFPCRKWRPSLATPGLLVYLAVSFTVHSRVSWPGYLEEPSTP